MLVTRYAPLLALTWLYGWFYGGCAETSPPTPTQAGRLSLEVAQLELEGVGDIIYELSVSTPDGLVWTQPALSASRYGDGQSLSYVGPCDASFAQNTVTLRIVDLFDEGGAVISRDTWVDPTNPPLSQGFACQPNADTRVEFKLVILRSAGQGFFDVAVNFSDVFCSAKLDCKQQGASGDAPILLLHDPETGERADTAVLAFACTAGPEAETHLYHGAVALVCGSNPETRIELPLGLPDGNAYTSDSPAPAPLVQFASYRGRESLTSPQGQDLAKRYWNLALAIDRGAITSDCRLEARMSVSDGALEDCATPSATTYPLVIVDAPLISAASDDFACTRHPLSPLDTDPVHIDYTESDTPETFAWQLADGPDATTVVTACSGGPVGPPTAFDWSGRLLQQTEGGPESPEGYYQVYGYYSGTGDTPPVDSSGSEGPPLFTGASASSNTFAFYGNSDSPMDGPRPGWYWVEVHRWTGTADFDWNDFFPSEVVFGAAFDFRNPSDPESRDIILPVSSP